MILCLESSTTSAKALLFDPEKREVTKVVSEAYPQEVCSAGGEAGLHDAQKIVEQTLALGHRVCAGINPQGIEAIAVGGTFHSVVVCDASMKPVTPTYTWMYNGARRLTSKLRENERYTKDFYHRTGCMVHALYPAFQLMLLRDAGFSFKDKRIASQSGLVFFALTGEYLESAVTHSGGGLINTTARDWDEATLSEIGLKSEQMAKVAGFRDTRPLSPAGAAALGLPAGIPVLPSHPDGALNQVGSGALIEGVMTFSVGTSAALRLSVSKPLIPEEGGTWCYLSPDKWMSGAATNGACNCVDWAKDRFFPDISYREVESRPAELSKLPFFLPFIYGERCPGWQDTRTGGFYGLLARHTATEMYFSVLEGILFNLYQCYKVLSGIAGVPRQIQLSGGILNSPQWKKMCADIFGMEMHCAKIPHASLVGAAVLAMEVTGHIDSIENYTIKADEIAYPDIERHGLFPERYKKYLEYYCIS